MEHCALSIAMSTLVLVDTAGVSIVDQHHNAATQKHFGVRMLWANMPVLLQQRSATQLESCYWQSRAR